MHYKHLARRPLSAMLAGICGVAGLWTTQVRAAADLAVAPHQDAAAQHAEPRTTANLLDPISVTATRTATAASRTAASVSVITAEDLEEQQPENIKDALRYEPGVTVRRAPYRPSSAATAGGRDGDSSINIRGLEGNRILLMEDGIRLPNSFSFGRLRPDAATMRTSAR